MSITNARMKDIIVKALVGRSTDPWTFIGSPGIGKTETARQARAAAEDILGERVGYAEWHCTVMEPADVGGGLVPQKIDDQLYMTIAKPFWMPRPGDEDFDHFIMVIDEFDKVERDTIKTLAPLINDGIINGINVRQKLDGSPRNVVIVVCANPHDGRNGSTRPLDYIVNRQAPFTVNGYFRELIAYWSKTGMHHQAISFVEAHPNSLYGDAPGNGKQWGTPRGMERLVRRIRCLESKPVTSQDNLPVDDHFSDLILGALGDGCGTEFLAHLRHQIPLFSEVVRNPETIELPDDISALYALTHSVAAQVDKKTATPVFKFLRRLPEEFSVTGLRACIHRVPMLSAQRDFGKWVQENRDFIEAAATA